MCYWLNSPNESPLFWPEWPDPPGASLADWIRAMTR
ncbi:hypothetical protein SAMN05421504_10815 [Amycolatopsis xylanica]|uniref:Uncharacterized protein n=1 Tax=Amycolatopsis xylanica TaxID=589385 RepID=A0A1H3P4H3_9PSEU|nr:hypothetical protein SAMN05421504_10815 [Amycolatopsis xylanica]